MPIACMYILPLLFWGFGAAGPVRHNSAMPLAGIRSGLS